MRRRLFTGVAAAAALAGSLLITGVSSAAAAPDTATATSADARGGGVTRNADLKGDLAVLQVDENTFKIVSTLRGVGKQVYDCNAGAWKLREPVATLATLRGSLAGIHGAGPFWASFDGSRVVGNTAVGTPGFASVKAPNDPARNVNWLKIPAAASPNGTFGTGVFSKVAFIQRLDTRGGQAPAADCNGTATLSVDYSTNYVFWARKP